jgi:DNA ligase 1
MRTFAELLDRLSYTPSRNGKITLLVTYFRTAPDPDRGYALAALTDGLTSNFPLRRLLLEISQDRLDEFLYRLSRDYVGDTAETIALIWRGTSAEPPPSLAHVAEQVLAAPRSEHRTLLENWLDRLDTVGRWALLKFIGGAPRVGVSARLTKLALAQAFGKDIEQIEEIWHGLAVPYRELFEWLEGRSEAPPLSDFPVFRPLMLSHPIADDVWASLPISDYTFEWKWDGIRVQLSHSGGNTSLFSRSGDDISSAFPDIVEAFQHDAILDGELLVVRNGDVAPFSDLQQRLNRKVAVAKHVAQYPAHIRFYDALEVEGQDQRSRPLLERRAALEKIVQTMPSERFSLSQRLTFESKEQVETAWRNTRGEGIEGLMIKRIASPYLPGRVQGHWYKMKRQPLVADCVMIYAQRGSGKRSSYYSDYTFAAWDTQKDPPVLVPVGKAYSGFSDEELRKIDSYVRQNTIETFGPVRSVKPTLVFEVEFDAIGYSKRHKSGVAMRFPRISRIRWDKPAVEADTLATLVKLIG